MSVLTRARARRVAVVVPVAALALVACGESVTPTQRVQNATSTVFDSEQVTVSVGLDLDDASRDAVLNLVAADQSGEQQISPAAIERLLDARVVTTVATTDGTMLSELHLTGVDMAAGAQPTNLSTSMSFVVEDEPLVELRQVAGVMYARADVAGLETTLETPGLADGIASFTADAPPALTEAAEALASGGWVSLDTVELAAQLEEQTGVAPTPSESATPDASAAAGAVQKFLDDAKAVITREIEVTENGDGAYTVTAPLDRILSGLTPSLKAVVTDLAEQSGVPTEGIGTQLNDGLTSAQEALTGREATVDLTLDGDRLSTVRMDVAQFLDEDARADMVADGVTALPVVVELDDDGEVPAPEGAVELDVAQMMEQLLSGAADVQG